MFLFQAYVLAGNYCFQAGINLETLNAYQVNTLNVVSLIGLKMTLANAFWKIKTC